MSTTAAPQAWKLAHVYHGRESANAQVRPSNAYSWHYEIQLHNGQNLLGGYFMTREEATAAMDLTLCRLSAEARQ